MNREKIHIVACFDHGFVMPTGVMMYSVCVNNPDVEIDFHLVIDESVTEKDQMDITDTIGKFTDKKTVFYKISSEMSSNFPLYKDDRLTRSTYYRLYLAEILPKTLEKVLYLDGDCIVRHSLLPLWNTDISSFAVGAVFDVSEGKIEFYNRLRYLPELGYFNAGVLLINLDYWRRHNAHNLFSDFIDSYSERIKFEDQDVLNVVFQNAKLSLSAKYNFQMLFLKEIASWDYWKYENDLREAMDDPVIVHYSTPDKPWVTYSCYPHPFNSSFYKYQDQTKWKGVRYEKRPYQRIISNYVGDILRQIGLLKPLKTPYKNIPPID